MQVESAATPARSCHRLHMRPRRRTLLRWSHIASIPSPWQCSGNDLDRCRQALHKQLLAVRTAEVPPKQIGPTAHSSQSLSSSWSSFGWLLSVPPVVATTHACGIPCWWRSSNSTQGTLRASSGESQPRGKLSPGARDGRELSLELSAASSVLFVLDAAYRNPERHEAEANACASQVPYTISDG